MLIGFVVASFGLESHDPLPEGTALLLEIGFTPSGFLDFVLAHMQSRHFEAHFEGFVWFPSVLICCSCRRLCL